MYHEQERDTLAFTHQLYAPRHLANWHFRRQLWLRQKRGSVELRAKLTELVGGFRAGEHATYNRKFWSLAGISYGYIRETVQFQEPSSIRLFSVTFSLRSILTVQRQTRRFSV